MKTLLNIAVIIILQQTNLNGQFYFNNHYFRENGFYDFSESIILKDCIYTLAHYNDPFVAGRVGASAIIKFNSQGQLISIDTLVYRIGTNFGWPTSLQFIDDSTLYFAALDSYKATIVNYNIVKRTFDIKVQFQPIIGKYFFSYPNAIHWDNNSDYFVSSQSGRLRHLSGNLYWQIGDIVLSKIVNNKVNKQLKIEMDSFTLVDYGISKSTANHILFFGSYENYDYGENSDFKFQQYIFEYDTSLQLISKIFSPADYKFGNIWDAIIDQAGNKYTASSKLTWHVTMGGNYFEKVPMISSYDHNGTFKWYKVYNQQFRFAREDSYYSLCFNRDSSEIVAVGRMTTKEVNGDGTIPGFLIEKGLITKINLTGDSIWQRYYLARGSEDHNNWNAFKDIKVMPQGGYLLSGYSDISVPPSGRNVGGWLMTIDEKGCYIPGCDLVTNHDQSDLPLDVKVYPNPTSDFIALIHGSQSSLDAIMVDLDGNQIKEFKELDGLTTYFLDLNNLAAGDYILILKDNNKTLATKNIVVAK